MENNIQINGSNGENLVAYATNGKTHIVVGEKGIILKSNDLISWNPAITRNQITNNLFGCEYATDIDIFVAVGAGIILTSTDGDIWEEVLCSPDDNIYSVVRGNGVFIGVGEFGSILLSTDGYNWDPMCSGSRTDLYKIIYEDNIFMAVGVSGTALMSTDGIIWENISSRRKPNLYDVIFKDDRFIGIGDGIFARSDGIWRRIHGIPNTIFDIPYPIRPGYRLVDYKNTIIAIYDGILFRSTNGGKKWVPIRVIINPINSMFKIPNTDKIIVLRKDISFLDMAG